MLQIAANDPNLFSMPFRMLQRKAGSPELRKMRRAIGQSSRQDPHKPKQWDAVAESEFTQAK
jgi:hypothetical protein